MCGICGVIGLHKARNAINSGLLALQHRAHDFAGMTTMRLSTRERSSLQGAGHVWEVFKPEYLDELRGKAGIGQIRYPTVSDMQSAQPIDIDWGDEWISVAHNGNFTNTVEINAKVFGGVGFKTGMDTETLVRLIKHETADFPANANVLRKIIDRAQGQLTGSGCVLFLTPLGLTAMRDKSGCHPLVYGKHPDGGFVVASEEAALTANGVFEVEEISPGTIVHFTKKKVRSWDLKHGTQPEKRCPFEVAYYAMGLGEVFGIPVPEFRTKIGAVLARECPVPNADLIVPVPNSGIIAGTGYAEASANGQLSHDALKRNQYAGRTFIAGQQKTRDASVRLKFLADPRAIKGKVIVLVDDSLVRGTTMKHLVQYLLDMGAAEVHVRLAFPVWAYPCTYGIATKSPKELAINIHGSEDAIRDYIGANSIGFISGKGFKDVLSEYGDAGEFCDACFTGKYW